MISSLTHTMCITMPSNRCPLHIGTYVGRRAELTIQVDANFAMKEALEKYYKQNPFDIIKCEDRYVLVPNGPLLRIHYTRSDRDSSLRRRTTTHRNHLERRSSLTPGKRSFYHVKPSLITPTIDGCHL